MKRFNFFTATVFIAVMFLGISYAGDTEYLEYSWNSGDYNADVVMPYTEISFDSKNFGEGAVPSHYGDDPLAHARVAGFKDANGPVSAWFLLFKSRATNGDDEEYMQTRRPELEKIVRSGQASVDFIKSGLRLTPSIGFGSDREIPAKSVSVGSRSMAPAIFVT